MALNIENVVKEDFIDRIKSLKADGYRFATASIHTEAGAYEITYHFDLNYELVNIRLMAELNDTLPSISPIFGGAFLIENEYQDLYGLKFENLTIDYQGKLYSTSDSPEHPMAAKPAPEVKEVKGA